MVLDIQRQESAPKAVYCKTGCGREIPGTLCHIGTRAGGDREIVAEQEQVPGDLEKFLSSQGLRKAGDRGGGECSVPQGTACCQLSTSSGWPAAGQRSKQDRLPPHTVARPGFVILSYCPRVIDPDGLVTGGLHNPSHFEESRKSFCYFKVNFLGGFSSRYF